VEVYRACQFVITVLTPATTGNGGIAYRFGFSNIQFSTLIWQASKHYFRCKNFHDFYPKLFLIISAKPFACVSISVWFSPSIITLARFSVPE